MATYINDELMAKIVRGAVNAALREAIEKHVREQVEPIITQSIADIRAGIETVVRGGYDHFLDANRVEIEVRDARIP